MSTKTRENLHAAFAGESQANRKYLAFARKAAAEGLTQIAKLFRATAEAETVHALAHFRVEGGIKSTVENLEVAIDGEGYEFKEMYPEFLAAAEQEQNKAAALNFKYALEAEKIHYGLYSNALDCAKQGKDLPESSIYVCSVCGHTHVGEVADKCPICGASKDKYLEIN